MTGLSDQTDQNLKYFPTILGRMPYMKCYSSLNGSSRFKIEEKTDSLNLIFFSFIFEINLKKNFLLKIVTIAG